MRRRSWRERLLGLAGLVAATTACCPVPVYRDVSVRPDLTVTVVDAAGQPVPGAAVRVRRFISGPPPATETHRWTGATDEAGTLHLDAIAQREPSMPLMMHGVNWYGWQVCAVAATGSAGETHHGRTPVEPPVALQLTLDPAAPDCAWEPWTGP